MKYNPVEDYFVLSGITFEIIAQNELFAKNEFAILAKHPDGHINWLTIPESSFETLDGCYYAILRYLEEMKYD